MDVLPFFESSGAYLKGHFLLTSGLHSPEYLQSARVLQFPPLAEQIGAALAFQLKALTGATPIGLVVAPALGGLIIGHEVARSLGTPFIFTERDSEGKMALRRGFTANPGTTAVVVEDVVTTGGSTREVIELLRAHGVHTAAAGSIIDRSGGKAQLAGVPYAALATLAVSSYVPEECPLCANGLPAVKPGSRPSAPD
ncbi:MAG: orotate phosphoribosyltransferase [Acidobacteriota bacterium]|nr:orotate phosphoribosyltransferase [Acidobacteriota bacterium]